MVKNEYRVSFSQETVIMIAIQLYERLRDLHRIGVVHNDIKPDNILVDRASEKIMHLIDFGLSQYYIEKSSDGSQVVQHLPKRQVHNFSGNFIFASRNSLMGFTKSR